MKKPVPVTNITIQVPDQVKVSQQDLHKMAQAVYEKSRQEQRDYEIYQQGVRDGRGMFGIFGL